MYWEEELSQTRGLVTFWRKISDFQNFQCKKIWRSFKIDTFGTLTRMKISKVLLVLLKDKPKKVYDTKRMKTVVNGSSLIIGLFTSGLILSFYLHEKGYKNILTIPATIYMKSKENDVVQVSMRSDQEISQEITQFKTFVKTQKWSINPLKKSAKKFVKMKGHLCFAAIE